MYIQSLLFLFHAVQEVMGFGSLQTLFYYLKLPPLHIIPCWPGCPHAIHPSGFPLVTLLVKVATQASVSGGDLLAMGPTLIVW
jgi:hypothetical protein